MNHDPQAAAPPGQGSGGYEKRDLSVKAIAIFGIVLTAVVIAALISMVWLYGFFEVSRAQKDVPPSPLASVRPGPPGPRLQVNPIQDLKALRAAEDTLLNSYGWVNKEAGIARIPIDRAMDLVAEQGLPVPGDAASKNRTQGGPR
jgi:hypothetical protein